MIKPKKALENISPNNTENNQSWRLKLDLNENIYGCASNILSTIRNISAQEISLYPTYEKLKNKFCEKYNIDKNNIIFTNGANEAHSAIITSYLEKNEEILSSGLFFSTLENYTKINNAQIKYISCNFNKEILEKNISQNTKIIFISTPNDITGELTKASAIENFLNKYKDILFVIDCSYINFSYCATFEDYIELTKKYENVVIVKSCSCDYAIAGIRFGVVIANSSIIENLKKVIIPYSVNIIALHCALSILNDTKRIDEIKELNHKAKELLIQMLSEKGFKPYLSETNFILCDFENYSDFYFEKLKKYGVITKNFPKNSPIKSYLRITIPTVGGVKYMAELLSKKDILIFGIDEILTNNKNENISFKRTLENLSKKYDFVIFSEKSKEDIKNILLDFDIDKFFYRYITPQNSSDKSFKPNPKEAIKIIENCPHKDIKYICSSFNDVITGNMANIETIAIIPANSDYNKMVNNFKHAGAKRILNKFEDLEDLINS